VAFALTIAGDRELAALAEVPQVQELETNLKLTRDHLAELVKVLDAAMTIFQATTAKH
jgi:hypothetical protein